MITSKQRSYLKGLAQKIDATVYIGKQGLTENVIKEIENGLASRELVKVKIQEGCLLKTKETALEVAPQLKAEFVQAIGRKFILYRKSKDNQQIVLPAR